MTATKPAPTQYALRMIPIDELHESPTNPRRSFDPAALAELTASIKQSGLLNPITVRERDIGGFEIIAGARRFRASTAAGLQEVPAMVHQLSDLQVLELQVVENLQRSDLHPLDEAIGFLKLHGEHAYSVNVLAEKVGKSPAYVYSRMQLAKLPAKAQTLFLEGKIDLGHALLVSRIPVASLADEAASGIAKGDFANKPMTQAAAREYVRRNFQCDLQDAPFDTNAKDLLEAVGACGPCPKRTGNQRDLFGAVKKGGADMCTDPKCFEAKAAAAFRLKAALVEQRGGKVLVGKAADRIQYDHGKHVDLDAPCVQDPKCRSWRQVLGAKAVAQLPVILGRSSRGYTFERVAKQDLEAAAKACPKLAAAEKLADKAPPVDAVAQKERERAKRHRERQAQAKEIIPQIVEAVSVDDARVTHGVLMLAIESAARWERDGAQKTWKRLDLPALTSGFSGTMTKAARQTLEAMPMGDLQGLLVEILISGHPSDHYGDRWSDRMQTVSQFADVPLPAPAKGAAPEKKAKAAGKRKPAAAAAGSDEA